MVRTNWNSAKEQVHQRQVARMWYGGIGTVAGGLATLIISGLAPVLFWPALIGLVAIPALAAAQAVYRINTSGRPRSEPVAYRSFIPGFNN